MPTRREFLEKAVASAACSVMSPKLIADSIFADVPEPSPEIDVFVTDANRQHKQQLARSIGEAPEAAQKLPGKGARRRHLLLSSASTG